MLEGIIKFAYLLEVDPFWIFLILGLLLLLGVTKCLFPWEPEWKAKKTKDEDGNEITIYYRLKK